MADLRVACRVHDRAYGRGGSEEDRLVSDRALREAVYLEVRRVSGRAHAWLVALVIYRAVRRYGGPHFVYR